MTWRSLKKVFGNRFQIGNKWVEKKTLSWRSIKLIFFAQRGVAAEAWLCGGVLTSSCTSTIATTPLELMGQEETIEKLKTVGEANDESELRTKLKWGRIRVKFSTSWMKSCLGVSFTEKWYLVAGFCHHEGLLVQGHWLEQGRLGSTCYKTFISRQCSTALGHRSAFWAHPELVGFTPFLSSLYHVWEKNHRLQPQKNRLWVYELLYVSVPPLPGEQYFELEKPQQKQQPRSSCLPFNALSESSGADLA